MADDSMALLETLRKATATGNVDVLREGVRVLRRRYLPGWWPTEGEVTLFNPGVVAVTRYRFRGTRIPSPWNGQAQPTAVSSVGGMTAWA